MPRRAVGFPAEDGEGAGAEVAGFAVVVFEHLHVGVVLREAAFADGGEVGGFPAAAVEVVFYLGGHGFGILEVERRVDVVVVVVWGEGLTNLEAGAILESAKILMSESCHVEIR